MQTTATPSNRRQKLKHQTTPGRRKKEQRAKKEPAVRKDGEMVMRRTEVTHRTTKVGGYISRIKFGSVGEEKLKSV